MSTMTTNKADGIFTDLITEAEQSDGYGSTFKHEDGSVTVICQDYEGYGDSNPRDYDNTATLVSDSRDYNPIDDGDSEIEEMREAFEVLTRVTDHWNFEIEDWCEVPTPFFSIKMAGGYTATYDLDDLAEAWVVEAYLLGLNAEQAMDRYIANHRPDIAAYQHHWSVTGTSQGDWREGYAYVTRQALADAGYSMNPDKPLNGTYKMRAASMMESELNVYGLWFAGEVFYSTTITPVGEDHAIGEHGGYYTGDLLGSVESCYGHLGYESIRAIAEGNSSSPVIEQIR